MTGSTFRSEKEGDRNRNNFKLVFVSGEGRGEASGVSRTRKKV